MKSRSLILAFLLVAATVSVAKPPFWKVFSATYKIKPESAIGKAKCLNCHLPPAPPARNSYGKAVEAALRAANARMVNAEMLKAIEGKNMGDKVSFIAKIKADKVPGVKAAAKPTKPKKKS